MIKKKYYMETFGEIFPEDYVDYQRARKEKDEEDLHRSHPNEKFSLNTGWERDYDEDDDQHISLT